MREIKFRAWDGKEMHYDAFVAERKPAQVIDNIKLPEFWQPRFSMVNMRELMQFTGLRDKDGKEIYEGDVLYIPYNHIGYKEVKYTDGQFDCRRYNLAVCRIVGNVHEHPHLLTGKEGM